MSLKTRINHERELYYQGFLKYIADILITFKTIGTTLITLELGHLANLTLKYLATEVIIVAVVTLLISKIISIKLFKLPGHSCK